MALQKNKKSLLNHKKKIVTKQGRKRRTRRILHYTLAFVLLLIIGVVLSLTVFFKLETVELHNIEQYSDTEILGAIQLPLGTNLFLADTASIPATLKTAFPYIEHVDVQRILPSTIQIDIYPSYVAAALQDGEEYALITASGKMLERGLVLVPPDVILVKGVPLYERQPGDYFGEYNPQPIPANATEEQQEMLEQANEQAQIQADTEKDNLAVISYVLDAVEKTNFEGITNLDLSDPLNMKIMYENRLELRLGTELDIEYKFKYIKERVIPGLDPRAHGVVNAENVSRKGWIVYTPKEGYSRDGAPLDAFGKEIPIRPPKQPRTKGQPDDSDLLEPEDGQAQTEQPPKPDTLLDPE